MGGGWGGGRLEGWWAGEKATPLTAPGPYSCECPGAQIPAPRRVSDCLLSDWLTHIFSFRAGAWLPCADVCAWWVTLQMTS